MNTSGSDEGFSSRPAPRMNTGPQGLPLVKPPWGRITAIDLNSGDHVWMVPNGPTPDYIKNHPALKGLNIGNTGQPGSVGIVITKSLVITGDSQNPGFQVCQLLLAARSSENGAAIAAVLTGRHGQQSAAGGFLQVDLLDHLGQIELAGMAIRVFTRAHVAELKSIPRFAGVATGGGARLDEQRLDAAGVVQRLR